MPAPSFRSEVHAEQARSSLGRIVLIRPLSFAALTAAAVAVAAAIFAFMLATEYAKKATLSGTLIPASGAIRIVAPQPGLVRERRVREGERVGAGEALLRIVDARATRDDGPVATATLELLEQRAAGMRSQRAEIRVAAGRERQSLLARIEGLEAERRQLAAELEVLAARGTLAGRSLDRLAELERRGFASPAQREQKDEDSLDIRARMHATTRARLAIEREIASLRIAIEQAAAQSRAQDSALEAQLAALSQEQVERRAQADAVVTAPEAGMIAALLVEPGQVVGNGTSLATLLPDGSPLEAHLFAPSRSIGFVRAGQEVLLRYPAFPYQKFGSHRARVLSVSRSAIAPAELGLAAIDGTREPMYRVKVALASQAVSAYGREEPLQAGMQVEADVLLDRRRIIEWVFEPLLSLTGRA